MSTADDLPPSLFKILREDNTTLRVELNGRLDGLAANMVTTALFAASTAAQKERDDRQDARIRALEDHEDERDREVRQVAADQRKARAQLLTAIGLSVLGMILTVIGGITLWTITQGLQQLAGGGGG